jgi:20S proteasome alpha/beta subunit
MPLKPPARPIPKPKIERLPKGRKALTIVAGFRCHEGIVLCADTQETVGASKRNIPKLRFEPNHRSHIGVDPDKLAVCFCGAGSNGVFMDEMIERAWDASYEAASLDEACNSIKTAIKDYYKESGAIYQVGYCPEVELIYGVKMHGESRLFYSLGPAVVEKKNYATGGQGLYLADFIASRSYNEYLDLKPCVILAAYILFETKENVEGCGGDSHIAILRNEGTSGQLNWHHIQVLSDFLRQADKRAGDLLLSAGDFTADNETYKAQALTQIDLICRLRDEQIDKIKDHSELLSALFGTDDKAEDDEYGFPISHKDDKD